MLVDAISVWLSADANARVVVEFPFRNAYLPEIKDFRQRMTDIGLRILDEGDETGYDDWGPSGAQEDEDEDEDQSALVTCWWSCWAWQASSIS